MSVTFSTINKYQKVAGLPYGIAELFDGHTKAWYIYTEGIALSGSYVTQWNDVSGNDYHLISYATDGSAATDANRPTFSEVNGIVYDGATGGSVSKVMISGWSTFGHVYVVLKQIGWTNSDALVSFAGTGSTRIAQANTAEGGSPNLHASHSGGNSTAVTTLPIDTWGILRLRITQATPLVQIIHNDNAPEENTSNMTGYTSAGIILGAVHAAPPTLQRWGNVAIKEVIFRDQYDDTTTETAIYDYLSTKYSI